MQDDRRTAREGRIRPDHRGGHARVARARRADHEGSAELPRGLSADETAAASRADRRRRAAAGVRRAVRADALAGAVQCAATGEHPAGDARPGVRHRAARARVARVSCGVQR
ncbi:conserved hypothetical protein [Burkholderia cenocepacia]|nr:conserved hypothetical protein [Burkholderia cenocepacia]